MRTHEEIKAEALSDPEVKAEYDGLENEFELLRSMLGARQQAGMTQADVAERMGTHPPAVARLESFHGGHSPSLRTLRKYAEAVGCQLEVRLIPQNHRQKNRKRVGA